MENKFTCIECDGVDIIAFIEGKNMEEHPIYYPGNIIFFMKQGQLNLKLGSELITMPAGSFSLIRKYTVGSCFKTWTEEEGGAISYAFLMQDSFIQQALEELKIEPTTSSEPNKVIQLPENAILKGLFDSMEHYVFEEKAIEKKLVQLKTQEALLGILKDRPDLVSVFSDFATPERAELAEFMEHHWMHNYPLERFAQLSGRSLSTFHREFKKIFNISPHKWIMKKRLQKARELLMLTDRMPSQIYLEIGFEDLAHFSRSFKKEFGVSPTGVKKLST